MSQDKLFTLHICAGAAESNRLTIVQFTSGRTIGGAHVGTLTDGSMFQLLRLQNFQLSIGGIVAILDGDIFAAINTEASRWDRLKLTQYRKEAMKILL